MSKKSDLTGRRCKPCKSGIPPFKQPEIESFLQQLKGWQQYDHLISKTYRFRDYYQTIAFVNMVAWISHREDHHPELVVNYNSCHVEYTTHSMHGLSENDFICAAKLDELYGISD
jgi:4a-hydroxytetrahydrobiopterin dehydratase